MAKTYTLKDLWPLLPFEVAEGPLLATLDLYGGGLVKYAVNQDGIWLFSPSQPFNTREYEGLAGLHPADRVPKHIDGVNGYIYAQQGGEPLLPFPFTARKFREFDERAGGIFSCAMDKGGYPALTPEDVMSELDKGPPCSDSAVWSPEGQDFTKVWLTELEMTNADAADLARIILSGEMPEPQETPAPEAGQGAPVVGVPKPMPPEQVRDFDALTGLIADAALEIGAGASAASVSTMLFQWALDNAKPGRLLANTTDDILRFRDGRFTKEVKETALKQRIRRHLNRQDS